IFLPSGDHDGSEPSTRVRSFVPVASITATEPVWVNAIREPSGDQLGSPLPPSKVIRVSDEPLLSTVQISPARTNAMEELSGAQSGAESAAPAVMNVTGVFVDSPGSAATRAMRPLRT